MEKKDYVLSFISKIQDKEKDSLYKFFTRNTVIVFLEDFKEVVVPEFVDYLEKEFFNKEIIIKRVLESKVCTKVEMEIEEKEISFLVEVKDRRIKRLEVM